MIGQENKDSGTQQGFLGTASRRLQRSSSQTQARNLIHLRGGGSLPGLQSKFEAILGNLARPTKGLDVVCW